MLKHLLENHEDVGCNFDDALCTLLELTNRLPGATYYYSNYEELIQGPLKFLEFSENAQENDQKDINNHMR